MAVGLAVDVGLWVAVTEAVAEAVGLGVAVPDTVGVGVDVGEEVGEAVMLGVAVKVGPPGMVITPPHWGTGPVGLKASPV